MGEFTPGNHDCKSIQFRLDLEVEISNWILHEDSTIPEFDGRDPPSIHSALATNDVLESVTHDDIREAVQNAIDKCGYVFPDVESHELIGRVWEEVCKIFEADTITPYTDGLLALVCKARTQHRHFYGVVSTDYPHMVPAADSSLALLEEKCEVDGWCCICLDELDGGGNGGLSMPCSHNFHGGCIKEWLRNSHFCPLCRYEMPTQ